MGLGTKLFGLTEEEKRLRRAEWRQIVADNPDIAPTVEDSNRGFEEFLRTGMPPAKRLETQRVQVGEQTEAPIPGGGVRVNFPMTEEVQQARPLRIGKEQGYAFSDDPGNVIFREDPRGRGANVSMINRYPVSRQAATIDPATATAIEKGDFNALLQLHPDGIPAPVFSAWNTKQSQKATQESRAETLDFKENEALDKRVQQFSSELEQTGIPDMTQTVQQIFSLLPETGQDIPGYGKTAALPDFILSSSGKDLRQAIQKLINVKLKNRSGAAVTPPEFERFKKELGEGVLRTDDQLRNGLANAMRALIEQSNNIYAGFSPAARSEYLKRGGTDYEKALAAVSGGDTEGEYEADVVAYAKKHGITKAQAKAIKDRKTKGK